MSKDDTLKLPPIYMVVQPEMKHMSTKIRWYYGLGYPPREIYKYLGIRYQQVRNVINTEPKRAMREDVPPYVIKLAESVDDVQAIMDGELDRSLAAGRTAERKLKNR